MHRRGRKHHVGCYGANDDGIELGSVDAAALQRVFRRQGRQIGRRNIGRGNMPLGNTDTALDPFIIGIDQFFEIGVGENAGR